MRKYLTKCLCLLSLQCFVDLKRATGLYTVSLIIFKAMIILEKKLLIHDPKNENPTPIGPFQISRYMYFDLKTFPFSNYYRLFRTNSHFP